MASNTSVARALLQRLQQLQRCEGGEGSVEIKRHVTKALAAVRAAASSDPRAAADDDELFSGHDSKPASSASQLAVDAATGAPPSASLMSLKAQRITSGALHPPPSLALPWTTTSHEAPPFNPPFAPPAADRRHAHAMHKLLVAADNSSTSEDAEAHPAVYSAQRYSPRAEDGERVDMESEGQVIRQDRVEAAWSNVSLHPDQTSKQQQTAASLLPMPQPSLTPPASAARPPSPSPSPSSSRSSPSLPSLLDSIALASAGHLWLTHFIWHVMPDVSAAEMQSLRATSPSDPAATAAAAAAASTAYNGLSSLRNRIRRPLRHDDMGGSAAAGALCALQVRASRSGCLAL